MRMTTLAVTLLLSASISRAEPVTTAKTPDELRDQIEALKPAQHVWRAIEWKTCPLEALKEARDKKKPVIAWVFLGVPTDERC